MIRLAVRSAARGYTLVELLVVLVVIGVMLGLVSLSIVPDPSAKLRRDAERLEALFALAAEEAQLSSRPLAWRGDEHGYAFYRRDRDGWTPMPADDEFRARAWDVAPMRLTLEASDVPRWATRSGNGLDRADDGGDGARVPARRAAGRVRADARERRTPRRAAQRRRRPLLGRARRVNVRPRSIGRTRAHGFTLIEVLIALVVVSLVLAASMRAGGTMIVTQDTLRRATLAGWSAENALADVRLPRTYPALGLSEAPCPQLDVGLVCVVDVRTTPNPAMRRVDVRVFDATDRTRQLAHRVAFQANLP